MLTCHLHHSRETEDNKIIHCFPMSVPTSMYLRLPEMSNASPWVRLSIPREKHCKREARDRPTFNCIGALVIVWVSYTISPLGSKIGATLPNVDLGSKFGSPTCFSLLM